MRLHALLLTFPVLCVLMTFGAHAGSICNEGTVALSENVTLDWDISGSGVFSGTGAMVLTGSLNPGSSPGWSHLFLDTTFAAGHTLIMEIAGTAIPGVDFDSILLGSGTLTLGGTLQLAFFGGFDGTSLVAGQQFNLISTLPGGRIQGTFDSLDFTHAPLSSELYWEMLYGQDALRVRVERSQGLGKESQEVPLPEAETWFLVGLAVAALALRSRGFQLF